MKQEKKCSLMISLNFIKLRSYKNGVEVEDIRQMMEYDAIRTVYYKINFVQSEISHNHGRYSIDMQEIGKIIEENSNN